MVELLSLLLRPHLSGKRGVRPPGGPAGPVRRSDRRHADQQTPGVAVRGDLGLVAAARSGKPARSPDRRGRGLRCLSPPDDLHRRFQPVPGSQRRLGAGSLQHAPVAEALTGGYGACGTRLPHADLRRPARPGGPVRRTGRRQRRERRVGAQPRTGPLLARDLTGRRVPFRALRSFGDLRPGATADDRVRGHDRLGSQRQRRLGAFALGCAHLESRHTVRN